ncbi:MAG: acyl carrier protein [Pseudomonadota bacterium]
MNINDLKNLLAEEFEVPEEAVTVDAHLFDDLEIDSIDAIDMLSRLRELTGIEVPADALKSLRTVGDVLTLIESR